MSTLQKIIPFCLLLLCVLSTCKSEEEPIIKEEPQIEEENPNTEECEALADLGLFTLLDSSKAFIPYPKGVNWIVFSDSSGREYIGEVVSDTTLITQSGSLDRPCKLDSTIRIYYSWDLESVTYKVNMAEFGFSLLLSVYPRVSREDYTEKLVADVFYFGLIDISAPFKTKSSFEVLLNPRNYPYPGVLNSFTEFESELIIHNKEFKNVYVWDFKEDDQYKIYYNDSVGIVGVKNIEQSIDLKYERLE